MRKLALRIDPTKAPKLNLFGWNVGARQLSAPQVNADMALPIVEITSCDHIKALAQVYFEKVDRCYGFVDRRQFFERLEARWAPSAVPNIHDSVLCGVAALGCLFSQRSATVTELHLARCARSTLDGHQLSGPPCLDLLTGWTLRTVYLRATSSPHATWVASCTLMHLVEASGLHPESSSAVLLPSAQGNPDLRRRIVGMAHHLNVWTSFDLGLSRVSFQNTDLPPLPSAASPDDYTAELLALLPVSLSLDPGRPKDETDLTSTLSKILAGSHTQPPSVLAQCNLVLCILRRIHTQNLDVSTGLAEQILALLKKGLGCAQELLADCSPWHHVANVPFQIICVLLTLDTRSSLSLLPEAMRTLRLVASTYDTDTMRDAYSTACLLVVLHQQRRKDDLAVLEEVVNTHQPGRQYPSPSQVRIADEDFSWLGALVADMPGLQRIGKSIFLPNAKSFFPLGESSTRQHCRLRDTNLILSRS